ncbi:MAG: 2-C-methyl-D-erythritol 4-phosphate cytidylyltransferase [Fuerstiella sp.]|jgi:2-C-methyl-D-erythritol 4-phosphate cytidylyltransferase|nr:2-C-methyl-D-erythritol 4-phosphate cytidylyltransferase [Fuerstiella sp.]MCP4511162.1 2-C-methyl-D-erythritol 4-phosphate cytidylyltransferase [Fuerstiella sp.]MDG2128937.1 2-C-methyl-D-erythritol 4-phosphate cytidylyltransferase [Fuerstiella sp.]
MSKFAVILPAAGESRRFTGFPRKKPFVELKGRAVWLRTAEHFLSRDDVSEVMLVLSSDDIDEFKERFRPNLAFMDITIVKGGACRAESVRNGISSLTEEAEFIAIHDAARPLLTAKWLTELFAAAAVHDAVIPGVPVSSTVKAVDENLIQRTVDRRNLVLAQTPQVFRRTLLQQAFDAAGDLSRFTDDASIVEAYGQPVHVHPGSLTNIKITTAQDFHLAEALLDTVSADSRVKDLHPFSDDHFR